MAALPVATRKPFVGGNWKSFNMKDKVSVLGGALAQVEAPANVDVMVAPTALYLSWAQSTLGKQGYIVAAQNSSATEDGAFTGEISAKGLASFDIKWVILGHSERRSLFGETNAVVGRKVAVALQAGLQVVACVGEQLSDRNDNKTEAVVAEQLEEIRKGVAAAGNDWSKVVVAYEPVWAIGTGVVATPKQAQDTHAFIRDWLAKHASAEVAHATRIIYGGSVKPSNAAELFAQPDIDGFLVGGASLVAADFQAIWAVTTKDKAGSKL